MKIDQKKLFSWKRLKIRIPTMQWNLNIEVICRRLPVCLRLIQPPNWKTFQCSICLEPWKWTTYAVNLKQVDTASAQITELARKGEMTTDSNALLRMIEERRHIKVAWTNNHVWTFLTLCGWLQWRDYTGQPDCNSKPLKPKAAAIWPTPPLLH